MYEDFLDLVQTSFVEVECRNVSATSLIKSFFSPENDHISPICWISRHYNLHLPLLDRTFALKDIKQVSVCS